MHAPISLSVCLSFQLLSLCLYVTIYEVSAIRTLRPGRRLTLWDQRWDWLARCQYTMTG